MIFLDSAAILRARGQEDSQQICQTAPHQTAYRPGHRCRTRSPDGVNSVTRREWIADSVIRPAGSGLAKSRARRDSIRDLAPHKSTRRRRRDVISDSNIPLSLLYFGPWQRPCGVPICRAPVLIAASYGCRRHSTVYDIVDTSTRSS